MPIDKPLHVRLAVELAARIDSGEWRAGTQIPSIRDLAAELRVSPFTVSTAIKQLQAAGRLETIHGKGTFVPVTERPQAPAVPDFSWQNALLRRPAPSRANAIVQPLLLQTSHTPDTIVLASGGEATDVLPLKSLESAWRGLLSDLSSGILGGWAPNGEPETKAWIADYLARSGVETSPENVIVTNGGQQALSLVAHALLAPNDTVLVERPMYPFALSILESVGVRCIDVPVDEEGQWVDAAEDLIERFRPKLALVVPTGQVPTGLTLPLARRRDLLEAARKHGIMILEDDHGSEISYDRPSPPPIKSLDTHGHVIYVKSFGKLTLPGLRIGCIVAEGLVLEALSHEKLLSDRYTSPILQAAFLAYVTKPSFARDLRQYQRVYQERRDAMLEALDAEMPPGVHWTVPTSGFYLWFTVPRGISALDVAARAAANGVLVARAAPFFAQGDPDTGFRLTFTSNPPDRLRLGIKRLADAVIAAQRDADDSPAALAGRR
jgi:DNA-binding transcriptional MocR family regulator